MIVVRFLKSHPPYNAGETAGFDPEVAQRLISSGIGLPTSLEKEEKIITGPPKDKMIKSPPKKK